jgi:hypothetical protein
MITWIYGLFLSRGFINYEPAAAIVAPNRGAFDDHQARPAMRANDSKSSGVGTVLLGIAAIGLAGMAGTIGLIHEVGEFGPKVGDIVSFEPLDPISRDMHARLAAIPADDRPGVACVLDVQAMHAGGGSLVIESRDPATSFGYRVHWAGTHSSNDAADCGASVDLKVNLDGLETLAMAAGGFGVPAAKQAGVVRR